MKNKTKIHRNYDETIIESVTCDICKRIYQGQNWESERFSALETEVKLKTGSTYPEGGMGEEIVFDICPFCFENTLIPMLKNIGVEPTTIDWDW